MKHEKREVTCQCKKCLDTVDITLVNRRGELSVEDCTAVRGVYKNGTRLTDLIHRPGHCDGKLTIIWSGEEMFQTPNYFDPLR